MCLGCGQPIRPPTRARVFGGILFALGLVLSTGTGYLLLMILGVMRRSDDPRATVRFTGDGLDAALVVGVLGVVLAFGLFGVIAGAYQLRYGRRHPKHMRVAFAFAILLVMLVLFVS
jgi:hypothetical protein